MEPAIARVPPPIAFRDGLGIRQHTESPASEPLEILALRKELTTVPAFEFALRERVSRLAAFRHACYGPIRGVSRIETEASSLALVSDRVLGDRLSEILELADRELIPLEIGAALAVLRQLIDAVAILHETVREVCHGAIAPERIIITPDARLVMVEHVLGAALGSLQLPREQYWKEMRIALPATAHFDRRADVAQIGVIALALLLGRPLRDEDFPGRVAEIAGNVGAVSPNGGLEPLPDAMREWLMRALQLDPVQSFASAVEAREDLDLVLAEIGYTSSPAAFKAFLAQYHACDALQPAKSFEAVPVAPPAPAPVSVPPSAPAATKPTAAATKPAPAARTSTPKPEAKPKAAEPAPVPVRGMFQQAEEPVPQPKRPSRRRVVAAAVVLLALASGGSLAAPYLISDPIVTPLGSGTLVVNTNPPGAAVVIDGRARGTTPLMTALTQGTHVVEVSANGERRTVPVTITAGGQASQLIEMPNAPAAGGDLQVRTEPAGARVTVDGQLYGTSPLTVSHLAPGSHVVKLENEVGAIEETITIEAGVSASLVVPLKAPQGAPVSGWISVIAPADVQVFENSSFLGSSRSDRIMVPAGRHEFDIVNESLGYRTTRTVTVAPGQVAPIKLDWPKGLLAVNALPWAEVFIDGERVGETPIGNVTLPIGKHEVVFKHPELGEQRHQTMVTAIEPARLSVDLRKK